MVRRILFVCLGNICRSPLVEVVARQSLAQHGMAVEVASCGTGGWHVGAGADPRMLAAAAAAGYDLGAHRARQLSVEDFERFDLLLAMDRSNLCDMLRLTGHPPVGRVALFLEWAGIASPAEFPDPYFGEAEGFAQSVALAKRGVSGLIERLRSA